MRVEVRGAGLEADLVGRGPEALLFVHGLGSSRRCWVEAPRFFDLERVTLVLPDLPGFGGSDPPAGLDCSMDALAEALSGLLAHLGIDRPHVVAHSMGGAVALLLAGSAAVRPASFVSAEGNLVSEDAFMSGKVARLKEQVFVRVFSKWLRMAEESLGPERTPVEDGFLEDLRRTSPLVLYRTSVSCQALTRSGELAGRFRELDCPRLYIAGERTLEERELPEPVAAEAVPVLRIPAAGHFMMAEAEPFYSAVRRHVEAAAHR